MRGIRPERRRRLTLEGLADVDAGRLIDDEAMQAWADSLGTDQELPLLQPD
jgi:predicted transcriptional regulator